MFDTMKIYTEMPPGRRSRMALALLAVLASASTVAAQKPVVLSLSQVLRQIDARSPQVLRAEAEQQQARAKVGQARAAWFGRVDVYVQSQHYNDSRLTRPITYPPNVANYPFASDQLGYGIDASLPLDVSRQIAAEVDAARAAAGAARWSADDTRLRALLNGATLYRDLQSVQGKRLALQEQLAALTASVKVAKAGVRAGTFPKLKRLRLQAAQAKARAELAGVEGNIRKLRAQLAAQMGQPRPGVIAPLSATPTRLPVADGTTPGVRAAESALQASQSKLAAAKRSLLPQFSLRGGWNENAIQGFHRPERTWQVGLNMKLNLWSGGGDVSAIDAAQSGQIVAQQDLRSARLALRAAREAAIAQWRSEQQAYTAAQAGLAAALQSARIERGNFRAGLGTATDLLDAEAALAQARATLTTTLASWWQADAALRYAYGKPPLAMTASVRDQQHLEGVAQP